jgi:hypothetical protein
MSSKIIHIFIAPIAGAPMQRIQSAEAIAGQGLAGDRYVAGAGSWNRGRPGKRQVSFVEAARVAAMFCEPEHTRRNIVTAGFDLEPLIENPGTFFRAGTAVFSSVKYCDPCPRPSTLAGLGFSFKEAAERCHGGGLIAEVVVGGTFSAEDEITVM